MAPGVSNSHLTGDVTRPERSRSCQIYLDGNILKNVIDSIGQTPCSLNIILLIYFFADSTYGRVGDSIASVCRRRRRRRRLYGRNVLWLNDVS